jgi:hypothetical protein
MTQKGNGPIFMVLLPVPAPPPDLVRSSIYLSRAAHRLSIVFDSLIKIKLTGSGPKSFRVDTESRHQAARSACSFRAKGRHQIAYSITSSARASSEGGMVRSSAFAVRI